MKGGKRKIVSRLTVSAGSLIFALSLPAPPVRSASAILPSGGSVAAGSASVLAPNATSTLVVQSSRKAIINWQSFSVGSGATVTFQQPDSGAITLNRVTGAGASAIDGNLFANGQVWLINGNGILFGQGSRINIGGLIATTSDIRDSDFLSGNYNFGIASDNRNAAVINKGLIKTAPGGSAVLSAARVANEGVIEANLGHVVLSGADTFAVDFDGDNLIRFAITTPVSDSPKDANGKAAPDLVSNSGTIAAQGGKVLMTARAARNVVNNVINTTGIIEATTASVQNGVVVFDAGDTGAVNISGIVDVSGKAAGESGGTIALSADRANIADGARLDASGNSGGGSILIGSNPSSGAPEQNVRTVSVGQAELTANAGHTGNGGTVTVYASGETIFAGSIEAKGGLSGGNGGTVETSGSNLTIAQSAHVDTSAPAGVSGTWLLDPQNLDIDANQASTVVNNLATTSVVLEATGDINVLSAIKYGSANSLSLLAKQNVNVTASVQNAGTGSLLGLGGWDGVTPPVSAAAIQSAYGNNGGSVLIGGANAAAGVAFGSMNGTTVVAASSLNLTASNGYAQVGYHGDAQGGIILGLRGQLTLTGGANAGLFAQVGHGGYLVAGGNNAPITALVAGNIAITAGTGAAAYGQIGNGGFGVSGDQLGNITVSAGGTFTLTGNANSYTRVGNGGASSAGNDSGNISAHIGGGVTLSNAQIGNAGTTIAGTVVVTSGSDVSLGAGSAVNANANGDALTLAAQNNFINAAGSGALNAGSGRWLVFLNAPANNSAGGLSALPFYNRAYNFQTGAYAPVTSSGNRFVYTLAPTLTVTADSKTKVYGTANPPLTATVTGLLGGDSLANAVSGAPSLSTTAVAKSNIGDYAIVAGLGTLASDLNYGFQFVNGTLHIDPAALTASLTGTVEKVYDGTTAATLTASNYQLSGVIGNDNVGLNNPASGSYDTKNVGINKTVTVGGLALIGADSGNYTLASNSIFGNVGIIDAAQLIASLTGKVEKTYDGTTAATLTASNYQLSGVIGNDNVGLNNPTSGSYDTKNVGINKTVTVGGVALNGADKNNYTLASNSIFGNVGIIDAAQLVASLTGKVEKTYDGTAAATLTASNYQLSGVIGNDNVGLNNPASGSYDTKNVGINKTVTVGGLALTGTDSGNYTLASNSIFGNVGIIDAAQLVASLTGKVEKTYDGTTSATLAPSNYQLSGVIGNDNVGLNNPANGSYDTKNVGINKTVTVGGLALTGTDSGNYTLASNSIFGNVGIIDAAQLVASLTGKVEKTYDGTTAATLTASNYQLSGVIGNDNVGLNNPTSGSYDTKNVGINKTVTVGGVALNGADKNNYTLASNSIFGNVGIIDAAQLVASLTGKVEKTYDGTAAATLTASNYQLSGVIGNDNVGLNNPTSGSYDTKNVGINKTVTVGGLALTGTDSGNYTLASNSIFGNVGIIDAAQLVASLTGKVEKTYDGTTAATLTASNYQLSGVIGNDNVGLNNPASGSYDTKNVGINKTVTVGGLALTGTDSGNYTLASNSIFGNVGIIDAAQLVASLTRKVEKTYDGTTAATLTPSNYQLSGTVAGDNVSLNNPASGSYDTKNVGINKTVTVSGVALTGADAGNYTLASNSIFGNVGIIDAAQLVASLTGKVEKTYDGTTAATLTASNYQVSGVVGNDNVGLNNPTIGTYDTKNVGINKTVTVSGVALTGADAGNYVLASSTLAANIGIIDAAQLSASLTGTVQKTYDGTTAATLTPSNYQLSGTVAGDNVSLNNPASGSYDTKNVGINKTVTVNGVALTGADAGNYVLASSTLAGNIGIIDAAQLSASLTGTVQKTYDGTTAATLTASNYQLSGTVAGDNVSLNNPASGSYDTKNVGINKTVTVNGVALTGADAGNYVLASSTLAANIGIIDAAQLVASLTGKVEKTYDGTTAATLTAPNYQLSGVIGNDNVGLNNPASGSYDTKDVGINKTVSVSGLALTGADSGNYTLASSSISANIGIIDAAQLAVASLTGTVEKTYDGTTAATLTAANYQLSGVVGSDNVGLNNPTSGSYDTKNVGTSKTVSVNGLALTGTDSGNYTLASSSISGNIGIIDSAQLVASLTGTVQKTYNGTTTATLASSNYQVSGVVAGDSVGLNNPASGSYDTKNVGINKTVSVSGLALIGADSGNYTLASSSISASIGIVDAAQLVASLTGTVQKTYNGTTTAILTASNYQVSGIVAGDSVGLNNPASGSYDTKNVGINKTVSVSALALIGADSGNYTLASNNIFGNVGIIDAAQLIASLTGTVEKTYNGTTTATLTASNYQVSGIVAGDSVGLNNPTNGSYDTKNVGISKVVSVSGLALTGADSGNYTLASSSIAGNIGVIDAAQLTASLTGTAQKTYDGGTAATLSASNYQLSGVIGNDNVGLNNPASGSFDSKNVGTGKAVAVGGLALTGTDSGNYTLASGSIAGNIGSISAATVSASLTGAVEKVFDGTISATLTPANYQFSGAVNGDNVGLNNPTTGSYDTSSAGINKVVTVIGLALTGADSVNYTLASDTVSAAIGVITNATTNVVIDNGVIADLIGRPFIGTQPLPPPIFVNPGIGNPSDATSATGSTDDDFAQSNMLADTLGNSLSGEAGSVRSSTIVLIEGLLRQFEPPPGSLTPHAVPPFGQTYSSWGNEAFWQ